MGEGIETRKTESSDADVARSELPVGTIPVAIAYHSVRGHTARLARAVAEGVRDVPGAIAETVALDALTDGSWRTLDRADALIFGCPTFMGGVSAVFKAFAEQSLSAWRDNLRWRNKVAGGFTHSQAMSGDKLHTLQYLAILAAQHGMLWVSLDLYPGTGAPPDLNRLGAWLGAMGQSDPGAPADLAPTAGDLATARHLGRRVAETACQLRVGRHTLAARCPLGPYYRKEAGGLVFWGEDRGEARECPKAESQ